MVTGYSRGCAYMFTQTSMPARTHAVYMFVLYTHNKNQRHTSCCRLVGIIPTFSPNISVPALHFRVRSTPSRALASYGSSGLRRLKNADYSVIKNALSPISQSHNCRKRPARKKSFCRVLYLALELCFTRLKSVL